MVQMVQPLRRSAEQLEVLAAYLRGMESEGLASSDVSN